jgi:single-strand DNA-binding protein
MNQVCLIGRLGRDPELRVTQGGVSVAKFSLAVPRRDEAKSTDWLDVTCFGKTAEAVGEYLKKGAQVGISGRLRQDKWTAQDGQQRSRIVVIAAQVDFLSRPAGQSGDSEVPYDAGDDDVPF